MRYILVIFVFVFLSSTVIAQKSETYSRAKIHLDRAHTIDNLAALGLAIDHGEYKKGTYFVSDFSSNELKQAKDAGFRVEIVIADVVKHYAEQNKKKAEKITSVSCNYPDVAVPSHFHLGSYAGFFKYSELLAILDSMQMLYPGIISRRQAIDTFHTIEGRPIYWVRISNNPTVGHPEKPQMLVSAIHHAREPDCLSATIFYMWHMLEHYNTDPEIKAIIDNTELYFIPCVNPDGYIFNETFAPMGGGMHRKNRRINSDGSIGVDLNRNYGFMWGYDNIGSSPTMNTETYRGPSPFSEPETQAVKWFADQHQFKFAVNYHSYNNDLIYSWGYQRNMHTEDSQLLSRDGSFITSANSYSYGTCNEMLGYISNGDANDWMYGDITSKGKILAFCPEVGSLGNGFYPPASDIIPDCKDNLIANINTARLLLPYALAKSIDQKILINTTGYLHYSLERLGIPDTGTFTVSMVSLDGRLTIPATSKVYSGLHMMEQIRDSISYSLNPGTPNGQLVSYVLNVSNGYYTHADTVSFYYGKYNSVSLPSEDTLVDWSTTGWSVCHSNYYSAPACIKSSYDGFAAPCAGNYFNNIVTEITTIHSIDLTRSTKAYLHFFARWLLEPNADIVQVMASPAGLGSWQPLCGAYTKDPERGMPWYTAQQKNWIHETINLDDYLGSKVDIQFQLNADASLNYEGFYFDDFEVRTVEDSLATIVHTGIDKSSDCGIKLKVYPNPTKDQLTVSIYGMVFIKPLTGLLYDCLGRVVLKFDLINSVKNIDVSALQSGLYYLKVVDGTTILPVQQVSIVK